jgi:hypothetical protein
MQAEEPRMKTQVVISAAVALLVGSGAALAQKQTPKQHDSSPAPTTSQGATPDRPPAATMPKANAPSPETTGQAPSASEKMDPGMDSVGGPKTPPGEEKK